MTVHDDPDDLPERLTFYEPIDVGDDYGAPETVAPVPLADANLISSATERGTHVPVLDIDFPCRLVPSSTPGHHHLYLDGLELEWEPYAKLLGALAEAGVIEPGYAAASIERGMTRVRKPGVVKAAGIVGRQYLERGDPVTVVVQWAGPKNPAPAHPCVDASRIKRACGPRNVLIRRSDGCLVVRPFRGLRRPPE